MKEHIIGSISSITPDGNSAIVLFDQSHEGVSFGILSWQTKGRMRLLTEQGGCLRKGTVLRCALEGLIRGPEAYRIGELVFALE